MTIKLLADENLAALEQNFGANVELRTLSGRTLCAADIQDADALLIRSVTEINEQLLSGSSVRFVGSATIGTDHVDLAYLQQANIEFCNAPGSNADSVADYVCSSIAALVPEPDQIAHANLRAGVIGLGQVGSRVAKRLAALGYDVKGYDPFLTESDCALSESLHELADCDLISLHVPLSHDGPYPTHHMINAEFLGRLSSRAILINTSRGGAIATQDLVYCLHNNQGIHAVLDVWEGEPKIDRELLGLASIATPHIAGYAIDGKIRGTEMIAAAFYDYFEEPAETANDTNTLCMLDCEGQVSIRDIILRAYDVREDDWRLRSALNEPDIGQAFDLLRKTYPLRREFGLTNLLIDSSLPIESRQILGDLGFTLA
ncbi:MAG: 4-phosphoerythronate dehydrogenase [Pseudomonadales bacterium]